MTSDNLLYAVDLCMVVSGKNNNDAAKDLRNIPINTFDPFKYVERQLHRGHTTKLLSFQDAIQLIMVLPGKTAKETRQKFADIIHRFLAGDSSLIVEIQANAASDAAVQKMARASKLDRLMRSLESDYVETHHNLPEGKKRQSKPKQAMELEPIPPSKRMRSSPPAIFPAVEPQVTVVMDEAFQSKVVEQNEYIHKLEQEKKELGERIVMLSKENAVLIVEKAYLKDALKEKDAKYTDMCKERDASLKEKDVKYNDMYKQMTEKYNDHFNASYDNVAHLESHIQTLQAQIPAKRGRPAKQDI